MSQQSQSPCPPDTPPPNKRRRTALACNACRTRKSRCDGTRPRCRTCLDLGFECVYTHLSSSPNVIVGKDYLVDIEKRITRIEQKINISGDDSKPHKTNHTTTGRDFVEVASPGKGAEELSRDDETSDGMGVTFADEEDCRFFGPSSNIAFMRHISGAAARISYMMQPWSAHNSPNSAQLGGNIMRVLRPPSPSVHTEMRTVRDDEVDIFALPPEDETLRLIDQFFADTGMLFPYLLKGAMLATYTEAKQNNFKTIRRIWLGLLNVVLALATSISLQHYPDAEDRSKRSAIYFQRAVGLCDKQMMRGTSLEVVQVLLVMGQYLQGTQNSAQAWTTHGLAVRAALQLGLHSMEASRKFSPLEREVRKRTWYGCVVLDRTLSMTFGRPAAIPDNYVRLDLPTEYDPASSVCEVGSDISVPFYTATITLYRVMWNVIDQLYGSNIGCNGAMSVVETASRLLRLEELLVEWQMSLPPKCILRRSEDIPWEQESDAHGLEKLNVVLMLRFHNLRILIHRPILAKFLDFIGQPSPAHQEITMLHHIGAKSVLTCVESAREIISTVHSLVHSTGERRGYLGAWWFSLYYTFNAALVIFASSVVFQNMDPTMPALPQAVGDARKSLDEAIAALGRLDPGNETIGKCAKYLERISYVLNPITRSNQPYDPTAAEPLLGRNVSEALPDPQNNYSSGVPRQEYSGAYPLQMDFGQFMSLDDMVFLDNFKFPAEHPAFHVATMNG